MNHKEKLDELEKEAATLHNNKLALIESYTKAIEDNNIFKQIDIENQWKRLSHAIKSTNKRIVLLKEQSDQLNDVKTKFKDEIKKACPHWKKIKIREDEIIIFPSCQQFSSKELSTILNTIEKYQYRIQDYFIDWTIDDEKLGFYIKF